METAVKKRLAVFGTLTAIFLAAVSVLYWQTRSGLWLTVCMFTPAVSAVLTRLLTREGWKDLFLKPHFKGSMKWYILAWFAPPLLAYGGAALYFLVFPGDFAPLHSKYAASAGAFTMEAYLEALQMLPLAVIVNPLMGLAQCFGEEFAWRGYLLPKLGTRYSPAAAAALTGVIWGIWHAPIVATGYNYGEEHPLLGIAAMIVFCVVIGTIAGFLFFKVRSVWPVVLFHAALNGIGLYTASTLFMGREPNAFIGPDLTGVLGGAGFILAAAFCLAALVRRRKKADEDS